jgi:hypothetical protein
MRVNKKKKERKRREKRKKEGKKRKGKKRKRRDRFQKLVTLKVTIHSEPSEREARATCERPEKFFSSLSCKPRAPTRF